MLSRANLGDERSDNDFLERWRWPARRASSQSRFHGFGEAAWRSGIEIIAGQPGAGKTTIAMKIAATVSAGGRWPDGSVAKQGNVVIWSGEDDPADTLIPEQNLFRWRDDSRERTTAVRPRPIATAADSHKNSETWRGLQPLVDMAAKLGAALIGITHFTKGSEGRSPIDRVTGSVAFGALARILMVAAKQQDGEDGRPGSRVLMRAKSSIDQDDGGFNYDMQLVSMRERPDIIASVMSCGDAVSGNASDILNEWENVLDTGAAGERHEAVEFLKDFLSGGPKPQKEIKESVEAHCHVWMTIRRAQKDLGIKPTKDGMARGWIWALPEGDHQNTKMITNPCLKNVITFGERDHLRGESGAIDDNSSSAFGDDLETEI